MTTMKSVKLSFPTYTIHIPARSLEVENCGQCPYFRSGGHGEPGLCSHPKAPKGFYENAVGMWLAPPKWCPGRVK